MRKRIKVSIPKFVRDILNEDLIYFQFKMEKLCNLIVQEMGYDQTLRLHDKFIDERKVTLHFNLNKKNTIFFKDMINESEEELETEYFRRLFSTYTNIHPSIREKIIKKDIFLELNHFKRNKLKIKIAVENQVYDILPLNITRDKETGYNILKCQKGDETVFYRIREIKLLRIV